MLLALLTHAGSWDEAFDGRKIACHAVPYSRGFSKAGARNWVHVTKFSPKKSLFFLSQFSINKNVGLLYN